MRSSGAVGWGVHFEKRCTFNGRSMEYGGERRDEYILHVYGDCRIRDTTLGYQGSNTTRV